MITYKELNIKAKEIEYLKDYKQILDEISIDERINRYWNNYKSKNKYSKNIEFKSIIKLLKELLFKC